MKFLISLYLSLFFSIGVVFTAHMLLSSFPCLDCSSSAWAVFNMLIPLVITAIPTIVSTLAIYNYHNQRLIKKWQVGILAIFGIFIIGITLIQIISDFITSSISYAFLLYSIIPFLVSIIFITPYLLARNKKL